MSGPIKDRITVIEQIAHQSQAGRRVHPYQHSFSRDLDSTEQVWDRDIVVSNEWKLVDAGWFKDKLVGMMVIQNKEKKGGAWIEVRLGEMISPPFLIPPNESLRGIPSSTGSIYVRTNSPRPIAGILILYPR